MRRHACPFLLCFQHHYPAGMSCPLPKPEILADLRFYKQKNWKCEDNSVYFSFHFSIFTIFTFQFSFHPFYRFLSPSPISVNFESIQVLTCIKYHKCIFLSYIGISKCILKYKPWVCALYRYLFLLDASICSYVNKEVKLKDFPTGSQLFKHLF